MIQVFFIGQSYFYNDESQNSLIFQPIWNLFTKHIVLTETIVAWESKGLSNEKIRSYITSNKMFYPRLK